MSVAISAGPKRPMLPVIRPMMNLREILALAFRQRRKILIAVVIPVAVAIVLLMIMPKVYRAQSDILVKTGREYLSASDGDSNAATGPTSTKQEDINSELSLLTSRAVAQASIDSIGLSTLYPDLIDHPPTSLSLSDAAIELFSSDLSADPVKMSNIISVSFDASSPAKAQMVLDRVIAAYIAKHTAVFAGQRAEGYEDSIKTILAELDRLEARRTKIKLDSGIYDIAAQRAALITQRVDAEGHLLELVNNQSTLRERLAYLMSARTQLPQTTQSTSTDKNDEAVHGHEALIDLRQQEAALSTRYGASNPDLKRIQLQVATLERTMSGTSNSRTSTAAAPSPLRQQVEQEIVMDNAQLAPLDAERVRYGTLLKTLSVELSRLETADLALRTTTARVDSLSENLKASQARFQQARTQEQTDLAKQVSVVQVNAAIAPDKAVKPKKSIFLGAGLLLGLMLGGGIALTSILLNNTIVTEDAVERLIGLPVLVSLPVRDRRVGPLRFEFE